MLEDGQDLHRQEHQAGISGAAARQPPRPRDRRDRHRQDRVAAGAGGRFLQRGRSGLRRRHQGRSLRHRRARQRQGAARQARQGDRHRLRAGSLPRRVLGPLRRAGAPGARNHLRDGTAAALAPARSQRHAGRRAQHRLPHRRRAGAAAARPEGSARAAAAHRRERQAAHDDLRQRLESHRSARSSASSSCWRTRRATSFSASLRSTSRI